MIGVISENNDKEIIEEFFELFKTPWEFYRSGNFYSAVIVNNIDINIYQLDAKVIIIFGCFKLKVDMLSNNELNKVSFQKSKNKLLEFGGKIFPIYRSLATCKTQGVPIIKIIDTDETVGAAYKFEKNQIIRIGFDLFDEIRSLLISGQPESLAIYPTLEIHISNLRGWILESGNPLLEIPPTPAGHNFFACLTHDVDFIGIRKHIFDYTFFGFIYRAIIGSILKYIKKGITLRKLVKNWIAVLKLPLVYMNLSRDFWFQFDRYKEIENNFTSTYFFIPFKNWPKYRQRKRAVKYDVDDIRDEIKELMKNGYEIGLHGIDAWNDYKTGQKELRRISKITENSNIGVRMHWLYFDSNSFKALNRAGFFYDSTLGYNNAIGYRSGTTQVYKPLNVDKLLELPLHIQDTSMFFKNRMNLSGNNAFDICDKVIQNTLIYSGVLVINWHQRSLAPERLWDEFYIRLLDSLKKGKAYFATANEIVDWFKKRRAVVFEKIQFGNNGVHIKIKCPGTADPEFMLKIYHPDPNRRIKNRKRLKVTDMSFSGSIDRFIQY